MSLATWLSLKTVKAWAPGQGTTNSHYLVIWAVVATNTEQMPA